MMTEHEMTLTSEEYEFLRGLLEEVLKDTRVEEHRTRKLTYGEYMLHREDLIVGLLSKLRQPVG
jgi:hypothetical protein